MAEMESERLGCSPFLIPGGDEPATPLRLYAVLDQVYPLFTGTGHGLHRLIFAAAAASAFEDPQNLGARLGKSRDDFVTMFRDLPIFLIEIDLGLDAIVRLAAVDAQPIVADDQVAPRKDPSDDVAGILEELEGRWKLIELGDGGGQAVLYANLFGEARSVSIATIGEPAANIQARLDATDPLAPEPDASAKDIVNALDVGEVDHVAVYDVGQGGANGLVSGGEVKAYFDFGGGVTANAMTFPPALKNFCFCSNDVPLVLSHWDADHWSSEGRDTRAHSKTWIAPRQSGTRTKRGFHHGALIASILRHGRLLIWPASATSLTIGQITIWQCTGTSRNTSGLAMTVAASSSRQADPVLLPADAGYGDMPRRAPTAFEGIACPHHGGHSRSPSVPAAPAAQHARLMYSYGAKNTHGHALHSTRTAHDRRGWSDPSVGTALVSKVLNTELRSPASLPGHIGFDWGSGLAPGAPTCPGRCPLGIAQV